MKLNHLATNQVIITRKTTLSGYKKTFSTVTGAIGNLQPLDGSKTSLFGGAMGKTFVIFVDGSVDILEGDRLRDINTGTIYEVRNGGVTRRTHGVIDFNQVIISEIS